MKVKFRLGLFDTCPCHATSCAWHRSEGRCWTNLGGGNRGPCRDAARKLQSTMAIVRGASMLVAVVRLLCEPAHRIRRGHSGRVIRACLLDSHIEQRRQLHPLALSNGVLPTAALSH